MTDIQALKHNIDCRELIAADLGKPRFAGKWAKWPCPFHEDKTPSFCATAESWYCFGCQKFGDAVSWLTDFRKMEFRAALLALGADDFTTHIHGSHVQVYGKQISRIAKPPHAQWQTAAMTIIKAAEECLWSDEGVRAMNYLENTRGFNYPTIISARLGYVPGHYKEWKKVAGHSVPCGIVIPWIIEGEVWGIKVRRAGGDAKYQQVAGGNLAGAIYNADRIEQGSPLLLIEGEFNALAATQSLECEAAAVSLGSAGGTLNVRWMPAVASASALYAIFDPDTAGAKGLERLQMLAGKIKPLSVPKPHKDLNDMMIAMGPSNVRNWFMGVTQ